MSLEFSTGGGPSVIPVAVDYSGGRTRFTFSDGSVLDVGVAPAFDASGLTSTINQLQSAIAGHTASISASVDAIAALHVAQAADETHEAATQAAVDALAAKVTADEATVAALNAALAALQSAKTADEAILALLQTDVGSLKASRTTDEAAAAAVAAAVTALQTAKTADETAIAANASAVAALQAAKVTDEAAIAANGTAITNLQSTVAANATAIAALQADVTSLKASRTTDEASIGSLQTDVTGLKTSRTADEAAIGSLQTDVTGLKTSRTADEASIGSLQTDVAGLKTSRTADEAAIAALQAGTPRINGQTRVVVNALDDNVVIASYSLVGAGRGRTYTATLANPSVANALSIATNASNSLLFDVSAVASGFDGVAAGGSITTTITVTDDLGAAVTLPVAYVKRAYAAGTPKRVLLGIWRFSANGTFTVAGADAVAPNWTSAEVRCISGGNSGFSPSTNDGAYGTFGGPGGAVAIVPSILRSVLAAAGNVPVTTGVGGAAPTSDAYWRSNGGTGSSFGTFCRSAPGQTVAMSSNGSSVNVALKLSLLSTTSVFPFALPGSTAVLLGYSTAGTLNGLPGAVSNGPGPGGGGGMSNAASSTTGGNGGTGDFNGAQTAGGAGVAGGAGAAGSNGAAGSYGGGGAGGASVNGAPYATNGGAGGFPGGGGGGPGIGTNTGSSTTVRGVPGVGGNGAVDVFLWQDQIS